MTARFLAQLLFRFIGLAFQICYRLSAFSGNSLPFEEVSECGNATNWVPGFWRSSRSCWCRRRRGYSWPRSHDPSPVSSTRRPPPGLHPPPRAGLPPSSPRYPLPDRASAAWTRTSPARLPWSFVACRLRAFRKRALGTAATAILGVESPIPPSTPDCSSWLTFVSSRRPPSRWPRASARARTSVRASCRCRAVRTRRALTPIAPASRTFPRP